MTRRRGRGEGSIYRRKDGSWVAQYTVGGNRRYIYGKTRKDVAAGVVTETMQPAHVSLWLRTNSASRGKGSGVES